MTRIRVNLDDVESGFEVYPDDKYHVEIQESSKTKKSENGAYIQWIGKILDGEFENKLISWNTSLQEQALWNLKDMLEKLQVDWDEEGFEMEDGFGKELIVENEVREYDGRDRNNIINYFSVYEPEEGAEG